MLDILGLDILGLDILTIRHSGIRHSGNDSYNTSLEELDLSWNWHLVKGNSEVVGCALERMLGINRTLKVLNLSSSVLDTVAVTHMAAGLAQNASLTELKIGDIAISVARNNIRSEGWVHVFKALHSNTSPEKLNISHNKLEIEGSVALAEMLACNKPLTELNLRGVISLRLDSER